MANFTGLHSASCKFRNHPVAAFDHGKTGGCFRIPARRSSFPDMRWEKGKRRCDRIGVAFLRELEFVVHAVKKHKDRLIAAAGSLCDNALARFGAAQYRFIEFGQ
ncbi:MAG: hypothetical protein IJC48_06935 [Clostridia bacterium]|nr:hypothetical protein [Clostridia bacterium]